MLLWLLVLGLLAPTCRGVESSTVVAGYLPEYTAGYPHWDKVDFDEQCAHLTHLIIFSMEVSTDGRLQALDRLPPPKAMKQINKASEKYGTKVQLCFGGYGRTQGYPQMATDSKKRKTFIRRLIKVCEKRGFHGVDYNWEYPQNQDEWDGLHTLTEETKTAFEKAGHPDWVISMAYYPDGRQEQILSNYHAVDYFHSMAYDAPGEHSTWELAVNTIKQAKGHIPLHKLTLGLPFYSRDVKTGNWKSYRSLVEDHGDKVLESNLIAGDFFNSVDMIEKKTKLAMEHGLAGVMIWESGLDVPATGARSLMRAIRMVVAPESPEYVSVSPEEGEEGARDEL